jgi:hypothetical protein
VLYWAWLREIVPKVLLNPVIRSRTRYFPHAYRLCGLVVRVFGYRSRGPEFDSWRYQIFWEVVGLERGPLSLVSTIEELLGRNSSGCGLENQEFGRGDPLRWPRRSWQPRANKTDGNPHNQNNQRQLQLEKENRITVSSRILNRNNMYTWRWPVRTKHVVSNKGIRRKNSERSCA